MLNHHDPVVIGTFASIEDAAQALASVAMREASALPTDHAIAGLRWEAEVPDTDPLAWLNVHDHLIRMYCSNRDRRLQIATIGAADMMRHKSADVTSREGLDFVQHRLKHLPTGMRYYGGLRFQEHNPTGDSTWERFGQLRFVLPSVELIRDGSRTVLAANLVASSEPGRYLKMLTGDLRQLRTPPPLLAAHLPQPSGRINTPDRDEWEEMVLRALDLLGTGELAKLVLARRCVFDFGERLHPLALLQRLREMTPDSFHFCFNYGNEIAFIGATPERLYHRKNRMIYSEALAGTRPRGATADDDAWLASELMASVKERREHTLVVEEVVRALSRFCHNVTRSEKPEVLKLRHVQHLRTVIGGELFGDAPDTALLLALHPTPAVGGTPRDAALRRIQELEPFDRGWYSGPIGWMMRDEVEFAVSIRCGLVEGSRLSVYSGAGIMPESDPEQEWREIESKIGNFLRILTS